MWAISGGSAAAQIGLQSLASPGAEALDPAVRRWYVPQELVAEHHWRQWSATNYARVPYQRYVSTQHRRGIIFYDAFGNFLNQGWLIYNVSQANPEEFGTVLFEAQRFRNWFSEVAVASEQKGQYAYALTISSDLRTTLTPMVLSKPRLDGVQFDFAMDKYRGTFLYAQASAPRGITNQELRRTNSTTLIGGRFEVQIGDFVELGIHTANAHQANSLSEEALLSNWVTGSLTQGQNRTISRIEIALRDDSPDDGVGGAAYFPAGSDIFITYRDGRVDSGREIRFEPVVEGGAPRPGYIEANGNDEIRLLYDFDSASFINRAAADKTEIVKVEFRLVVANDYQVWMTSDQQTSAGEPVFLLVTQAPGNIKDLSNLRVISFEAGLPTATHILGGTVTATDVMGFDLYGEYDLNWNYRKYPNILVEEHQTSSGIVGARNAPAYMLNLSRQWSRFFIYGEAYHMHPRYNTQTFVTRDDGSIDYQSDRSLMDLVEDNDDQDRVPDTFRADWAFPDRQVFPGWDQNNDFVPDINQNDSRVRTNSIPDYEEPFLRFAVDRPEFLFGVDMNNNFWTDQYENDQEPDYPYKRDRPRLQRVRRHLLSSAAKDHRWPPARGPHLFQSEKPQRVRTPAIRPELGAIRRSAPLRHDQARRGRHRRPALAVGTRQRAAPRHADRDRRSAAGPRHLDQPTLPRPQCARLFAEPTEQDQLDGLSPTHGRRAAAALEPSRDRFLPRDDQQGPLPPCARPPLSRTALEKRVHQAEPRPVHGRAPDDPEPNSSRCWRAPMS